MIIKNSRGEQVSVKDAIEGSIIAHCYGDGQIEAIKGYAENAGMAIGKIVAALVDKGILGKENVQEMLGYNYNIED